MFVRLTLLAPFVLLAACAAAVPGYSPPPFKEKNKFGQAQESGSVRGGIYEMSETEKALDCKRLTGSMQIAIARMKDGHSRDAPSAASTTMKSWMPPVYGAGSAAGADREADYARERAKLEAYNRHLASKNCRTVDIEAELARPPEAPGKRY